MLIKHLITKSVMSLEEPIAPLRLTICAYFQVSRLIQENHYDGILSIKDPKSNPRWSENARAARHRKFTKRCRTVLCMDFVDCDQSSINAPRDYHIAAIVEFARKLKRGSRVLVHCIAGISRSTASAMILLQEHGMGQTEAYEEVLRIRPEAVPNRFMLELFNARRTEFVFHVDSSDDDESDELVVPPAAPAAVSAGSDVVAVDEGKKNDLN